MFIKLIFCFIDVPSTTILPTHSSEMKMGCNQMIVEPFHPSSSKQVVPLAHPAQASGGLEAINYAGPGDR